MTNTPPRVLFLIPNYGFGGAQKVLADHSRLLAGNADVLEAVFNDWDEKRVYETGHPYKSLEVSGGGSAVQRMGNFYRRIKELRKLKQEFRPDITISHLEGADYISLLSGGRDKKIIVIHGSKIGDQEISGLTGKIRHKLLMPWLYKKADRIIAVSGAIREELIRHYGIAPAKVVALPNFFECATISAKAKEAVDPKWLPAFDNGSFKLITFARLATQKNLLVLFPLFRLLRKRGHDIKLYIMGDGELRRPLLAEAAQSGDVWEPWSNENLRPDADIYFLGYQSSPHAFLKHADLYLMTSLWEGFPMALCEAMASEIAVMAADCPTGPSEILQKKAGHETGLLPAGGLMPLIRNAGDEGAIATWADAIEILINDRNRLKDIREGGNARVQYYDKSIVGKEWISAYLGL